MSNPILDWLEKRKLHRSYWLVGTHWKSKLMLEWCFTNYRKATAKPLREVSNGASNN